MINSKGNLVNQYKGDTNDVLPDLVPSDDDEHDDEDDAEDVAGQHVPTDFECSATSGDEYVRRFGCKKRRQFPSVTSFANVGRAPLKHNGRRRFPRLIKRPRLMDTGIECDGTVDAIPDDESDDHISRYTALCNKTF